MSSSLRWMLAALLSFVACSSSGSGELAQESAAVSGITLPQTLRLDTATTKTAKLSPTFVPENATPALTWRSDTPSVASVDAEGVVSAVAPGKATIEVSTRDGKRAGCTVYVFARWLAQDFEQAGLSEWDLRPPSGPDGKFSVTEDGSKVLKYEANTQGGVLGTLNAATWARVPGGDYFVEARIKPLTNGTTGSKQLYLLARYQDDKNWYGAGFNLQSSTASTQVEIAKMQGGTLSRPVQVKTPLVLDTTWYTLRFELQGNKLTVYLDGVLIKSVEDDAWRSGPIGLYTANKSFEIDDIHVGDPNDRPVQLSVDVSRWAAEAGSAPKEVHVKAQKPSYDDGAYVTDTFSATSSDPQVALVKVGADSVQVTPLKAGAATITFTSGAEPMRTCTLQVTVEPEFLQPTATYTLAGMTDPAAGELRAYADTSLSLRFDATPQLGQTGSVRVFRKRDDTCVDIVRLRDETDLIGVLGRDGTAQRRYVNTDSRIKVVGDSVHIALHNAVLESDTEYYVAIADGLISGRLQGAEFRGLGKDAAWSFKTRPAVEPSKTQLLVDDDGDKADFRSVQGALNFIMQNAAPDAPVSVRVSNGRYEELLFLRGHDNVSITGESRAGVVIHYLNYEGLNGGSGASQATNSGSPAGGRALFLVEDCDMLSLESLTLENTMRRSTAVSSQAETLYFNSEMGRLIAKQADFISEQDTLQLKGYAWFYKTLVAGNVDFIWGANHVALFEESEIRSVGDSAAADRGFVVQARTVAEADKGFVFLRSKFTHKAGPAGADVPSGADAATFLARSSGNANAWDNVVVVECELGDHIHPLGWAYEIGGQPKSHPAESSAQSGWREFMSHGPGGDTSQRKHGYALSPQDVEKAFATRALVFAAYQSQAGWNPNP